MPVVIFDEATASLDANSESAVQIAVEALGRGGKTVVSVAHRLSTIRCADEILVLDGGRIVERGTFSELVAREGSAFRNLVEKQL